MRRFTILALALACAACQTAGYDEGRIQPEDDPQRLAKRVTWFAVASYVRTCHGYASTQGAIVAATAASLGALYYVRTEPRSTAGTPELRRRVSRLMDRSYKGRFGRGRSNATCRRVAAIVATTYRRQPPQIRRLIARLSVTLLRTDAPGQRALARSGATRRASRARYIRRATRIPRGTLKPSEQQLPIGN